MSRNPGAVRRHLAVMERLSPTARQFIRELAESSSSVVEDLRFAAELLAGDERQFCADPAENRAFVEKMRQRMAVKIRTHAQKLCDHSRLHGDTCRYCEVIVADGCFAEDYPPIPEDDEPASGNGTGEAETVN